MATDESSRSPRGEAPTRDETAWVLVCDGATSAHQLAPLLECDSELAISPLDSRIWLRFSATRDAARTIISRLPATAYLLDALNRLIRPGSNIPMKPLPELDWQPTKQTIERVLPSAIFPESLRPAEDQIAEVTIPLRLVPASDTNQRTPLPAEAVLADRTDLLRWVDDAPEARLHQLRWILVDDQALILGTPLPHVPGQFFSKAGRILVPSGRWWSPDLPVPITEQILSGPDDQSDKSLILWQTDGTITHFPEDEIQTLRRASVRAWDEEGREDFNE